MSAITLSPNENTQIYSGEPNKNYCQVPDTWIGRYASGRIYKTLIGFDLSSLPDGADITKAILKIYVNSYYNDGIIDVVTPYRITDPWSECVVTWLSAPRIDDKDYGESVNIFGFGFYNMNITKFVKSWHSGQHENNGMMLASLMTRDYEAKSISSIRMPNKALRPALLINYDLSEATVLGGRKCESFMQNVTATRDIKYSGVFNTSELSAYSVFIKNNGNYPVNAKIQISPDDVNWTDDGNEIIIAPGMLKYMVPYVYSVYLRIMYQTAVSGDSNATAAGMVEDNMTGDKTADDIVNSYGEYKASYTTDLTLWLQGQV